MNALTLYRVANLLYRQRIPVLPRILQKINVTLTRCVVPYECTIGSGSELGYGGIATVIHSKAVIGNRVMLGPCVTIGGRSGRPGAPTIEDDVMIGSGAQVLGPITIGRGATIGAGSVVIHDVAAHTTVAGVPAKTLKFKTHRFNDALLHGKPITPQLSANLERSPGAALIASEKLP